MSKLIARACLIVLLAVNCAALRAADVPPAQNCEFYGVDFLSSGQNQTGRSVDELARELPKALDACKAALENEPKSARLHARYARVLAVAGDASGALKEARLGAEGGSSMAMVLLGVMYVDGRGVARDYAAAIRLFRDAAKQEHPLAYFNLGVMQANGWGTALDDVESVASFHGAAARFDPLAMQILGEAYAKGRGVVADPAAAERWWKKAVERPQASPEGRQNPARIAQLGRIGPDTAALVAWYERQARAGDLWAQTYLGKLHEVGQWVPQDYAMAQTWYRRAAAAGHQPAQMSMASLYSNGLGVERDDKESRRWVFMAANDRCDQAAQAEPGANACDRLAGDAYDPGKAVAGLSAYCMRRYADRAIPACRRAVKEFPSTVRYRAQLARALVHAGKFEEARREASAAAAKGSTLAMTLLGAMSERGFGAPKNDTEALAWYRKAADLKDERAMNLVGSKAMEGVGVAKGSPEAKALIAAMSMWNRGSRGSPAETLLSRAEKGDAPSQHNLAAQFEHGNQYDEAIKWYTRAAEQGYGLSQLNLAQMYEKGIGVRQDTAEAIKWYRKSAERGDGESRYQLAGLQFARGNYAEAVALYRRSIDHDDYRAMLMLGEMYEQGRGVKKDMAEAVRLYEQASDRSPWAQAKLGILYAQGKGAQKNESRAVELWEKAAQSGDGVAQSNLGRMYEEGTGVKRDYKKALDWYLAAQSRGVPQASINLEHLFAEGRGAPSEASAALAWYRAGAEGGIPSAQYKLGMLYAKGEGVGRSETEAEKWLAKAAGQGHAKARSEIADLYFASAQKYEKGDGVQQNEKAANEYYLRAASFGSKRAAEQLAAKAERTGNPAAALELRTFFARALLEVPTMKLPPAGLAIDPGEDDRRTLRIRSAGTAQMEIAAMSTDAFEIIHYWEPTPNTRN